MSCKWGELRLNTWRSGRLHLMACSRQTYDEQPDLKGLEQKNKEKKRKEKKKAKIEFSW